MEEKLNTLPDPISTPELPVHKNVPEIPEHMGKQRNPGIISTVLWFGVLFMTGLLLSFSFVKLQTLTLENLPNTNNTSLEESTSSSALNGLTSGMWQEYQILESFNKTALNNLIIKLPPDVLEPVCDGVNCPSYGTYLPGGTRLTIATKSVNPGYSLTNTSIVDNSGNKFTARQTKILDYPSLKYSGDFNGITTGGYRFSKMEGIMIQVKPNMVLEINHFIPGGIEADFEADSLIFEQVINSLTINS